MIRRTKIVGDRVSIPRVPALHNSPNRSKRSRKSGLQSAMKVTLGPRSQSDDDDSLSLSLSRRADMSACLLSFSAVACCPSSRSLLVSSSCLFWLLGAFIRGVQGPRLMVGAPAVICLTPHILDFGRFVLSVGLPSTPMACLSRLPSLSFPLRLSLVASASVSCPPSDLTP